jgi:copper resistance protein D
VTPAAFAIGAQAAHFGAVFVLFGAVLFRLYAGDMPPRIGSAFDRWLLNALRVAAVIAMLSALAWWDSVAVNVGEGWADALSVDTLAAILLDTEFGRIWIWRLALLLVLIGALLFPRRSPWNRPENALVTGFAGVLVISLAAIGHEARYTAIAEAVHLGAKAVHLLAAAVWIGGLVPLSYVLGRAAHDRQAAWIEVARHALPRFSFAGYFTVSLILLSGCVIGFFHVESPAALFGTAYGRVLIAKICLFFLITGIALFNRLRLTPPILAGAQSPVAALWKSVVFEQILGASILLVASVLASLPPAHH